VTPWTLADVAGAALPGLLIVLIALWDAWTDPWNDA